MSTRKMTSSKRLSVAALGLAGILAGWDGALLAQQAPDGASSDRSLVEQFMPPKYAQARARALGRGARSYVLDAEYVAADLDRTGRKDFLVAVYGDGVDCILRVLRREGSSATLVSESGNLQLGGAFPKITIVDIDHGRYPALVVQLLQNNGQQHTECLFRWDGNALQSYGTWEIDPATGLGDSTLSEAVFLDLDGDGVLEIVNPPEFDSSAWMQPERARTPVRFQVYKIAADDGFRVVGTLEGFSEYQVGPAKYRMQGLTGDRDVRYGSFLASQPGGEYIMTIANGDGREILPVTSAEVLLNGELVAAADQVTLNRRYLSIPVTVKAENRLEVRLRGAEGSALYVGIGPASVPGPQAAPAGKPQQ